MELEGLVPYAPNMLYIHRLKHGKKAKELAKDVERLLLAYRAEGVVTITTDSDDISPHQIMDIQKKINVRPIKKLIYSTPKREFFRHFN